MNVTDSFEVIPGIRITLEVAELGTVQLTFDAETSSDTLSLIDL